MMLSPRRDAIHKAKEVLSQKPAYLDTETTGTGPNDNILEVAIIDHDGQVLLDTQVKPVGHIHPDAMALHGIDDTWLQDAPSWNQIWPDIEDLRNYFHEKVENVKGRRGDRSTNACGF